MPMAHMRFLHVDIALSAMHTLPQPPQFSGSFAGSQQLLLQQLQPAMHGMLHMPQLSKSLVTSVHLPLQHCSVPGHFCCAVQPVTQMPLLQIVPSGHSLSATQLTHWCVAVSHTVWPPSVP